MTPPADSMFPCTDDIPSVWRMDTPLTQQQYLCDGRLEHWSGRLQAVFSPIATWRDHQLQPTLIGHYPLLGVEQADQALEAACRAYNRGRGIWPTLKLEQRIQHMENFTCRMIEQRAVVVKLLMWEIGKSLPDAEKEFDRTVDYIRDTLDALKDLDRASSRFVMEQGVMAQIRRAPLGVVLCMGPFNYPLNETFTTLIPALIMGNTVIFKPPRLGVLLHQPLLQAFCDSFPPGVVNTVYGEGPDVIAPLMTSGRIDVLAFIGSSRVASLLKHQHPRPHRLRCVLGLEAKNPAIVLADADLDLAVQECVLGALSYNGQRCTALKILLVQRAVADAFVAKLAEAINRLPLGMPWQKGAQITPLAEPDKTVQMQALIDDARKHGAQIINCGGGESEYSLMRPALLYPVNDAMRLYHEEQFGPLVPVMVFDEPEEALQYLLDSPYGQQASLFGQDADTLGQLIDPLVNQVCRVNINSQCQRGPDSFPFTGRKDSAEGTLSVSDALRVFSIRTLVAAKHNTSNREIVQRILNQRASGFLSTDFIL